MFEQEEKPADDPLVTSVLEGLLDEPPSSATLTMLEALVDVTLSPAQQMLAAAAWERLAASVSARAMLAQHRATLTPVAAEQDLLDAELGLMLRRTAREMATELSFVRRVLDALPATFTAVTAGEASGRHLRAIEELTRHLPADLARQVDAGCAPRATTTTAAVFRRVVRAQVAAADPDGSHRYRAAQRDAGARLLPEPDGMATLAELMPATDGIAALAAVNDAADRLRVPDDPRTHGQRQVAALLDRLFGPTGGEPTSSSASAAPSASSAVSRRADVVVTIDLATLLGLRDGAGELHGYGPVPAAAVRELLVEERSTLRRLVYDDVDGVLVDLGRRRYVPDRRLRRLLDARDVTCRYPGCTRNARFCDTEHCTPYPAGATASGNCGLVCRRHHNLKTHHGFRYQRADATTGETRWTTPLGFTYRQHAATYSETGADPGDTIRLPRERLAGDRLTHGIPPPCDDPPY